MSNHRDERPQQLTEAQWVQLRQDATQRIQQRADIGTETFKGLLIINGGGAIALLAFMQEILIGATSLPRLAIGILIALFLF